MPALAPLLLVLLGSLALNAIGIGWGLPNYVDWSVDTVAPYRVLEGMEQRFSDGWWDRYPPFHLAILGVLYAPYLAYLDATGRLGSAVTMEGLQDPLHTFGNLILIARVVSVLMGVGVVFVVYLIVRRLFDERPAIFASLIVALNHQFVFYAHSANHDVPYLFWSMLGVYGFVGVLQRGAPRDYVTFALCATLAICAKDQAYALFLLSPLAILWVRWGERSREEDPLGRAARVLLDRRNLLAVAVAVTAFVLAQNLLFNFSGFVAHVRYITGFQQFSVTPAERLKLMVMVAAHVADGMSLPLFAASAAGTAYCGLRLPRAALPLLILPISYTAMFLNVALYTYPRYVLPIALVMSFFGGKVLADLWSGDVGRNAPRTAIAAAARAVIVAAFLYAAAIAVQLDVLLLKDPRYAAERWLERNTEPGAIVETLALPYAVETWYPRFPAHVRVRSSRLAEGTRWAPNPESDRLDLPNVYFGREAPDYIVLSEPWYRRFLKGRARSETRVLRELFGGRLGYVEVADFKTPALMDFRQFVNPRVLIFKKSDSDSVGQAN